MLIADILLYVGSKALGLQLCVFLLTHMLDKLCCLLTMSNMPKMFHSLFSLRALRQFLLSLIELPHFISQQTDVYQISKVMA